ncbi:MAG: T9SS type A sorting domain-containing protein, partial [Bacteroidota bacterium]
SLAATAAETKVVTCFGGSDGEATVYPSFGWGSYTYYWNNSQTGSTATGLVVGDYTVTVTDGIGCTSTAAAAVTGPSATLAATAAETKVVTCFGSSDGTATVYPSHGWGSYTYFWNNSQTGSTATGLGVGTYTVTVTDGHGCTTTASATVTGPSASLAASAAGTKVVTCFGGSDGTATVYPSDGWGSYTYFWNNSQTGSVATGLAAGSYTVTVTDGHGCTTTASATVDGPSAALIASASQTKPVTCFGGTDGEATAYPSHGWGSYSYSWDNSQTTATATSLTAGTYTVTITDGNGCTTTASATVNQPSAALAASAAGTKVVTCFGDTDGEATVYPSFGWGSYSYFWENSQTTAIATGLAAGSYMVTVTDGNGCKVTASATVDGPSATLAATAAGTKVVTCFGDADGTATVYPSNGWGSYTYFWNNSQTGSVATGLAAGSYTVTVTDGHGCTVTASATVDGPSATLAATAAQSKPVSCLGGTDGEATVYPSNGWGSYTYFWNNSQTGSTAAGLVAGTYYVTVTDGHGCTTTASAYVSEPSAALAATAAGTKVVTCFGDTDGTATVYPSFGWGSYSFFWNDSQTTAVATGLGAGNYTVTVTDGNGCTVTASATVSGPSASLAASAVETKPVSCFGLSDGTATVTASNGWGSYSYMWNNSQTGATATGLANGTYTVTVTDGIGCTTTASAYVSQPSAALSSTYIKTDVLGCHGEHTGAIDLTVNGGTAPYYFVWTGTGVNATAEDQSGLAAGTYNVTITDARSCETSTSAIISQPDTLHSNVMITHVNCNSDPSGTINPHMSGGTPPYSYVWDYDYPFTTDSILTGMVAGDYNVTVTDDHSCVFVIGPITITQPDQLYVNDIVYTVTCKGGSDGHIDQDFITGGVSPYYYKWSNGPTTPSITGLTAGFYTLTVTDAHSCTLIQPAQEVSEPTFYLGASASQSKPVTCFNGNDGEATVVPSGGWGSYTYFWNNSQTGATATSLAAGTYYVTVTDVKGCSTTASAVVYQPSAAIAASAAETKVVSCFGGSDGTATVYPSFGWGSYTYFWNDSQTGATATGLSIGTYTVTVTDYNGCTTTASATVTGPSAALAATAAETRVVTCFGNNDGTATVYPSFGWGSYTYFWNNSQTTAIATNLTAGDYVVTVTDGHGCTTTASATVTGPSAALAATAAETKAVTCFGGSDGTATVYPSHGWGSYTYFWNNSQTGATATGLSHGTYTVTVTDGHGCTTTTSATVTEPTQLTVSTIATNVNCHGESNGAIAVTAGAGSPGYQYSKDGGSSYQTSNMFNGLTAGTYQVWVKDSHSCTVNTSQVVSEPSSLTLSGAVVNNTCYSYSNGSVTLSVGGGTPSYNYNWSNGASVNPINNLTAGTYYVTVSDQHACSINSSYVVTQPAAWAISIIGHDTACCNTGLGNNNTTYTAPAPTGTYFSPVTYQWVVEGGTIVSGQNTNSIVISWSCCGNGKVYLTVTDAHTCALTTVKNVTILPPPAPVIAGPVSVPADTTGVVYTTPFVAGHLYTWSIVGGSIVSGQGTHTVHVNWGPFPACGCGQITVCESSPAGCLGCNTMNITIIPSVNYQLAGYVKYFNPYQTALNGVTVKLRNTITNTIAATTVTGPNMTSAGEPGYFSFAGIPTGTYYKLEATFNGTWGGNNATDALMVQLEAVNPGTILTPTNGLAWTAGDVNASTTITALDALYIKLRVVGSITSYPAGNWKFDNPTITIPAGLNPIIVNGLCVGDVNGSYIPVGMKEASFMSVTDDRIQTVVAGHTFSYEIRSNSAAELGAMTLFMGYDNTRFDVVDVTTSLNDGMKYVIENGNVAIAWSDPKSLTVKNDEPLFTLTVKAKAQLAEPTQIFSVRTGSEFADPKGNRYDDFSLKMGKVITPSATEFSMSNYPNPFANHTSIVYTMPESGKVKLVLTNLVGQTIRTLVDEAQAAGTYSVDVNPVEFNLTPGVYLYKIEVTGATDTYVKSNKMIFAK